MAYGSADVIGGFTPAIREAADEALRRASVYIHTREALEEAAGLVQASKAGVISTDDVSATLGELCRRDSPARTSTDEISLDTLSQRQWRILPPRHWFMKFVSSEKRSLSSENGVCGRRDLGNSVRSDRREDLGSARSIMLRAIDLLAGSAAADPGSQAVAGKGRIVDEQPLSVSPSKRA
jgi:hypothetical protein